MPFSFIDIEERKKQIIFVLFTFLVGLYFFGIWALLATARISFVIFNSFNLSSAGFSPDETTTFQEDLFLTPGAFFIIFLSALTLGFLHWYFSTSNIRQRLLTLLKAQPPDKEDKYHRRLKNIVDEVSIATGGRKFECMVLPTIAMNAFSIDDPRHQAVIGVTEGLLSRLNRAQLETVVAHEAAHIVSQDTLIKSIAVSIFDIYGFLLEKIKRSIEKGGSSSYGRRGIHPALIAIFIVTSILHGLGKLINMFISRQCEYRADAVAVRLTRDPFSLAQSLYRISKKWRGGGFGYERLESLFIMNPNYNYLDEEEGFFANLFSTHPPLKSRIDILLNISHRDLKDLKKEVKAVQKSKYREPEAIPAEKPRWHIVTEGKWRGPFLAKALVKSGLLRYESFVRREAGSKITLAFEDSELLKYLKLDSADYGGSQCPRCYHPLAKALYEGTFVYKCDRCKGLLLEGNKIPRILAREEQGFSEEAVRKAPAIRETAKKIFTVSRAKLEEELPCSKCGKMMLKCFYSSAYPIEVDKCGQCGRIWFDKDELEVLQYLIEKERF